jgi:hypothetical protein
MTIPHLKERIEYAREELAWLEKGAPEGEEPWRGWDTMSKDAAEYGEGAWLNLDLPPRWYVASIYRRRPKMLHIIDAKGKRHEFPEPMREAPQIGEEYWQVSTAFHDVIKCTWNNSPSDNLRLAVGLCQSTEEGAQMQVAALRAICRGGEV